MIYYGKNKSYVTYVKKAWLDNLGLKIPTTWDEMYEVMRQFTFNDPDGNGKQDTIGYTAQGMSIYNLSDFYQGSTYDFDYVNGKWVDGFTQSNFKEALQRIKKAYNEKILEITGGRASKVGFFESNKGPGLYCTMSEYISQKGFYPETKIEVINPIENANHFAKMPRLLAITNKAANPQMVFENVIEFMHDPKRGKMLFNHGVEGIHYSIENGKYVVKEKIDGYPFNGRIFANSLAPLISWDDPFEIDEMLADAIEKSKKSVKYLQAKPYSKTYIENRKELEEMKSSIMHKVVLEGMSINKGLKEYREKAKELQVEQILKEFNAAK